MPRLKLILVISLTAAISVAVTSAFWMMAFNRGPLDDRLASPAKVAPAPSQVHDLVLGPTGLAIPVPAVKREALTDTFTAARAGGRVHDAIDIMAPRGTPVVAAAPGSLEKLFFSHGGGGITAYIRSPDRAWLYYYAHLDGYAPGLHEGQVMKQGDPVGRVGSTGDASPAAPHLHFAIYRMAPGQRWWQGKAVNPYPLLGGKH